MANQYEIERLFLTVPSGHSAEDTGQEIAEFLGANPALQDVLWGPNLEVPTNAEILIGT